MTETDAYLSLCRADYRAYCYLAHEGRWIPGRAVSYICEQVQKFLETPNSAAYDILILSVPPQHGKSMTVTETLPSWYLGRWQEKRVIEISYSDDFAQLFGRRNKQKIKQFGWIFGTALADSPNSNTEFELQNNIGSMISRGVMSGVTGRAGDLMIIDDPIKNRLEADSETYRERLWNEWNDSFKTRLSAGAKVILIQTRWHEDDLAGRILQSEKSVSYINLSCEAEQDDVLGRPVGTALAPEIGKDNTWLKAIKEGYTDGSRSWNALYQGHPSSEEGNILSRSWWKFYDPKKAPVMKRIVISVDATFKDDNDTDFVAVSVWGKRNANIYLLDLVHERADFVKTCRIIKNLCAKYPKYNAVYIEDKANGPAIISYLRRQYRALVPVKPQGGKIARVNTIAGIVEAGNVYLPQGAGYVDEFIEECAAFPRGAHDDMVDSMSQALIREYYKDGNIPVEEKHSRQFSFEGEKKPKDGLGKGTHVRVF